MGQNSMFPRCPVCNRVLTKPPSRRGQAIGDRLFYECPRCGNFGLTHIAEANLSSWLDASWNNKMALSHLLRRMQMGGEWPLVGPELVDAIIATTELPTVQEQADNLIRWLGSIQIGPGEPVRVTEGEQGGIVGALTSGGFSFIVRGLEAEGLIKGNHTLAEGSDIELTFAGWQRWEDLWRGALSETKAFMAMQYGDALLDRIMNDYFRPAVRQTGFRLVRLDDESPAGLIDDRLRVEIQSSRFLIADLTRGNNGAYWEAGYAEGLGKPVIYTCEERVWTTQKSHFDTNHHLHIVWNADAPQAAMERLQATIRVTIPEARRADD